MRVGDNPQRNKKVNLGDYFHQVIVPVYIPNLEDYYKESFEVFKLCIQSLIKTCHSKTYISVISNGSCTVVNDYIIKLYNQKKIQDFTITQSIGKLNSILKGLSGINLPLVTITDADVLFLNNWQKATYDVFEHFPKVGYVSTTPSSKVLKYQTFNIIIDNLFSNKLKFTKVINPTAQIEFAKSIGNPNFYNQYHLENNLTIESASKIKSVIGGGHFVGTYRREVFNKINKNYTDFVLGGDSESIILDRSVAKNGFYRVSTENNYTYHLGNSLTNDYIDIFDKITDESKCAIEDASRIRSFKKSNNYFFKKLLFTKIISKGFIWKLFLKYKGLSNEAISKY